MPTKTDELLAACKAQHDAIDILFAMLIERTTRDEKPFFPSESGPLWDALIAGNKAVARAESGEPDPLEYSYEHLEAAACMWEYVLHQLRPRNPIATPWHDYREAYGLNVLRETVIRHAPTLDEKHREAVANGYRGAFDRDFVPKYMEDHITRILA